MSRPAVSVIVPFAGTHEEGERLHDALARLQLEAGDEVIVVDNTPSPAVFARGAVAVVRATGERSSYHARNAGVAASGGEWLAFVDADCVPAPDLLDRYFRPAPADRSGAVAGEIVGDPEQRSLAARWATARGRLGQTVSLAHPYRPYGSTANLLVRRAAYDQIGGFAEGIKSGGDVDLCWRLIEAGWTIEYRENASVLHRHRETVPALLRQARTYGSSRAWLDHRYPDCPRRGTGMRVVAGPLFKALAYGVTGRAGEARFRALDAAAALAETVGYRRSNRA